MAGNTIFFSQGGTMSPFHKK